MDLALKKVNGKDLFMMHNSFIKNSFYLFFILLTGCSNVMTKNNTKFEWSATECGPEGYPMEIIKGTFLFKGEEHGLYIPDGGTLNGDWGDPTSSHGSIKHTLPDRLEITFFSYTEKQFYRGEFDLPYDRIVELFQKGLKEQKEEKKEFPTYSKMMVGIAPGGAVAVWVTGGPGVEVFFGQAEKVELNPIFAFNLPFESEEESDAYIAKQLPNSLSTEELESLEKNGIPFGLWSRYRARYHWIATAKGDSIYGFNIKYVNGESERGHFPFVEDDKLRLLPVPLQMYFETNKYIYRVNFDDLEIVSAFEQLKSHENLTEEGRRIAMEFDLQYPRSNSRVRLYNVKESIELKKVAFKDW